MAETRNTSFGKDLVPARAACKHVAELLLRPVTAVRDRRVST